MSGTRTGRLWWEMGSAGRCGRYNWTRLLVDKGTEGARGDSTRGWRPLPSMLHGVEGGMHPTLAGPFCTSYRSRPPHDHHEAASPILTSVENKSLTRHTLSAVLLTALNMADRRRQNDLTQDAVAEAMASLELGIPERIARATARADGRKTPVPPCVFLCASSLKPGTSI